MIFLYLLIIVIVLFMLHTAKNSKPHNFPAGPRSFPVVGSLLSVGLDLKSAFQRWRREWGSIVGFKMGSELAVVISDFDMLNEAFKDDRFNGRPENMQTIFKAYFARDAKEQTSGGIVFGTGEHWKEQRRFAMRTLKEFGVGKSATQTVINDEIAKLVEELRQETGQPTNLKFRTNLAVVNTLWQILNGEKSDVKNNEMMDVFQTTAEFIQENSMTGPIMVMPYLRHLPFFKTTFEKARSSPQTMRKFTAASIKRHVETYEEGHQRDFIDAYLKKMSETTDENSSFHSKFGEANMQRTLMDIFGAGSETTYAILTFAFNYLTRFPEMQRKVQEEIDSEVGSRAPELTDRQNMPYTDAVIHEVLRHSCIVYTSPHATTEDVEFHGYTIPKGTSVFANTSFIMNDPKHWDKPEDFNPDRFIDSEGNFKKNERCIPFLVGKRYCLGQQLAQQELFLFLTGLLQAFTFSTTLADPSLVDIKPMVGFLHTCPSYKVILESRS
jgi:cytochrome P450 family 2 subfamily J